MCSILSYSYVRLFVLDATRNCLVHYYGSFAIDMLKEFENKRFKKLFGN